MAELVDKLFERHGIAVLGFDVVWAERDPSSGIEALDALAQRRLKQCRLPEAYTKLRPSLDFDARFAASLKGRPVVLGYYFNRRGARGAAPTRCPPPVLPKGTFAGRNIESGAVSRLHRQPAGCTSRTRPRPATSTRWSTSTACRAACRCCSSSTAQYYEALSLAMVRTLLALRAKAGSRVPPVRRPS